MLHPMLLSDNIVMGEPTPPPTLTEALTIQHPPTSQTSHHKAQARHREKILWLQVIQHQPNMSATLRS